MMRALAWQMGLPVMLLAGMLVALAAGGLVQTVKPGAAQLGPLPSASRQIGQSVKTRQLCEQIIAGKLRVGWHKGEVHARNQCKRDGW